MGIIGWAHLVAAATEETTPILPTHLPCSCCCPMQAAGPLPVPCVEGPEPVPGAESHHFAHVMRLVGRQRLLIGLID